MVQGMGMNRILIFPVPLVLVNEECMWRSYKTSLPCSLASTKTKAHITLTSCCTTRMLQQC